MYALSKLQIGLQSHAHFTDVCSRCVPHAYTDGMVPPGTAVALYPVNVLWSATVFTRRRVGVITAMTHVIVYVRLCLGGHGLTVDARLHVCIGRRHHCQAGVRLTWPFTPRRLVWTLSRTCYSSHRYITASSEEIYSFVNSAY